MARFSFFVLVASLVGAALANVPSHLYRADRRNPDKIKADGGIKSWGADTHSDISIIEHVLKVYDEDKPGHRQALDPWLSTSELPTIADLRTVDKPCWVYTIDTSDIAELFTEVAPVFAEANKKNGHADELEWVAWKKVPLSAVRSFFQQKKNGSKGKTYTWETWEARRADPQPAPKPETKPSAESQKPPTSNKPPTTKTGSQQEPAAGGSQRGKSKTGKGSALTTTEQNKPSYGSTAGSNNPPSGSTVTGAKRPPWGAGPGAKSSGSTATGPHKQSSGSTVTAPQQPPPPAPEEQDEAHGAGSMTTAGPTEPPPDASTGEGSNTKSKPGSASKGSTATSHGRKKPSKIPVPKKTPQTRMRLRRKAGTPGAVAFRP